MNLSSAFRRPGVRYLMIGGSCAVLHNLIMIGGAALGLHYLVLATVSFLVLVVVGYSLHARFTFDEAPGLANLGRYALAMLGNYPLTVGLLFACCTLGRLPVAIASPLATIVLLGWNYAASRWAIVRRRLPSNLTQDAR